MVLPLILGGLEAAAGAAPAIGAVATRALPYLGMAAGAIPAIRQGHPLEAVVQGGLGFLTGQGISAGGRMAGQALKSALGSTKAVQALAATEKGGRLLGALKPLAAAGIPLAGAGFLAQQALAGGGGATGGGGGGGGGVLGGLQQAAGGGGAMGVPGLGAQGAPSPYPYTQYAVPSGMGQYGPTPQFNPYNVIDPTGQFAASRLAEEKEQDVAIRGIQKEAAALAPIMEGRSKAEFMRQMAAAGIRANIQTQQQNLLGGLATARQMGLTGAQLVGQALATPYQYS